MACTGDKAKGHLVVTGGDDGKVRLTALETSATRAVTRVEVGGLPAQDWPLRVTLVYRRDGDEWRLAHRHADPLAAGISLEQAAAFARDEDR